MIFTGPSKRAAAHLASPTRTSPAEPFTPELEKELVREVLAMGLPSMAGFLLITIYDLVDIFWLARLGEAPVAAVTALSAYLWVLSFPNMIVGSGSVAFISRRYGAGNGPGTEISIKNTFLLKMLVGVVAGIVGLLTTRAALQLMGAAPDVVELGVRYGYAQWFALGAALVSFSVYTAMRGIGRPMLGMWISFAGTLINLILDPLLIFGIGPFPEFGIAGASIASACGFFTVSIWGIFALASPGSNVRVHWWRRPFYDLAEMKAMLRIGAPSGLSSLSVAVSGMVVVKLVAIYGTGPVALFGMAQKVLRFGRMLLGGLSLGSSALIGQYLGGGRLERAWLTAVVSTRLGTGTLLVFSLIVAAGAPWIVAFFFPDSEIAASGVLYLRLMAIGLPFAGITGAGESAFSGAGLNRPAMFVQLVMAWGLTVPAMLILGPGLGGGAPGTVSGLAVGEILGALVAWAVVRRGAWLAHQL
ncbi:MAG: MATE family efflux transporter [Gemmatimonadota bacterium]|nr:MAG: MATE family efflux transporter [Gemmatimonadota bacterium]